MLSLPSINIGITKIIAIPSPTKPKKTIPTQGLKKTHAIARTKQAVVPPTVTATIAATSYIAHPRSMPTSGIHLSKEMIGANRQ
jgi:hypothetical protein